MTVPFSVAAPRLMGIVRSVFLGLTPQARCCRRYAAKKRNFKKRERGLFSPCFLAHASGYEVKVNSQVRH